MIDQSEVYEFRQCDDCIYKTNRSPCPCDSCEQTTPTNFTEEEQKMSNDIDDWNEIEHYESIGQQKKADVLLDKYVKKYIEVE